MTTYFFDGLVHPERAQITFQFSLEFTHITSGEAAQARVSIVLNQIAIWIETDVEWDIYDLRNVAKSLVSHELAVIGFLRGLSYEVEIKRVLNTELKVDFVFGIDIPCLVERNKGISLSERLEEIRCKSMGLEGVFLHRCFADLANAMKNPDDTGFYCYRAIESLRQHCIVRFKLNKNNKGEQWAKLREIAGCTEEITREIQVAADPVRHGEVASITSNERKRLFLITWDVVDGYLAHI